MKKGDAGRGKGSPTGTGKRRGALTFHATRTTSGNESRSRPPGQRGGGEMWTNPTGSRVMASTTDAPPLSFAATPPCSLPYHSRQVQKIIILPSVRCQAKAFGVFFVMLTPIHQRAGAEDRQNIIVQA